MQFKILIVAPKHNLSLQKKDALWIYEMFSKIIFKLDTMAHAFNPST